MTWHGPNPLAGRLGPHPEQVEFDVAGEYRGINYGIVCSVRWHMQELLQHFRSLGVKNVACRGLNRTQLFEIDKWLFGALAQNPDLNVAAWCNDWAVKAYGAGGEKILPILDICAEVIRQTAYVNGVQWASWAAPQNLARLRFILFDRCAPCAPGSYDRLQPTEANINAIVRKKLTALEMADSLVSQCTALQGLVADKFLAPLLTSVSYLRAYVSVTGPLMESFFRFLAWEQTSSEVTREFIRIPLLASLEAGNSRVAQSKEQIKGLNFAHLSALTEEAGFVNHAAPNKFLEPFDNTTRILQEIAQRIDIPSASWWAYYPPPSRWPSELRHRTELYKE